MKVGSLVYATDQGLGILAKAFYDHGIVTNVMVIGHGTHPNHLEWYPNSPFVGDLRSPSCRNEMQDFCRTVDVMLFFETPFWWPLIDHCRKVGTKTALVPMHECMPAVLPAQPDVFLCPSLLDVQWASQHGTNRLYSMRFLPVPVEVPWRQRTRADVFVHNAGHGGLRGRNGTAEFLQAIRHVKSGARFVLRSQKHQDWPPYPELLGRATLVEGTQPYDRLWDEGDVFVFPERFNGLSLPLQEARAAGMLVMATNRFPMNTWLPVEPLIPPSGYRKARIGPPYMEFDEAILDPKVVAAKIDEWYDRDITSYSLQGKAWAEENSWVVLGPKYRSVLEGL